MSVSEAVLVPYALSPKPFPLTDEVLAASIQDIHMYGSPLVDPTMQRLEALDACIEAVGTNAHSVDAATVRAATDLNGYFSGDPALARLLCVGIKAPVSIAAAKSEVADGSLSSNPTLFEVARTMLEHLRVLSVVTPAVPELNARHGTIISAGRASLTVWARSVSMSNLDSVSRANRISRDDPKWPVKLSTAALNVQGILEDMLPRDTAGGILSLANGIRLTVDEMGDIRRKIDSDSFVINIQYGGSKKPSALKQAKTKVETTPAYVHHVNDEPATALLDGFVQPATGTRVKQHPLSQLIRGGGGVTLGTRHEFSGFGDKACIAVGILDYLAGIPEKAVQSHLANMVAWINEANKVVEAKTSSTAVDQTLKDVLHVFVKCIDRDFSVVAQNIKLPADPAVLLTVSRLEYLRQALAS